MRIAGGWDHHGRMFKSRIESILSGLGHELVDMGTRSDESSDYPDYAIQVGEAVSTGKCDRGILVCGTGIGMSIAANKVKGVRAAVVHDEETARLSRGHNDANVLCLAEDAVAAEGLDEILRIWLTTPHEGGRHARRVGKIIDYEGNA